MLKTQTYNMRTSDLQNKENIENAEKHNLRISGNQVGHKPGQRSIDGPTLLANASYEILVQNTIRSLFDSRDMSKMSRTDVSKLKLSTVEDEMLNDQQIQEKIQYIFDQIFRPYFEYNQNQNTSIVSNNCGNFIITWSQFEDAVNNNGQDQENTSTDLLKKMFDKVDIYKRGYLNTEQLLDLIKDDIINGHEEYSKQQLKKAGKDTNINYNTIESETYAGNLENNLAVSSSKLNLSA